MEMKIFLCDTEELLDTGLFERCYRLVSVQRREKIDRYKNEAARRQSLAAGILLEKAFGQCGIVNGFGSADGDGETDRTICYGQYGKPYLRDYPQIHFNLSHTKGRAMCVISGSPVGCDVEVIEQLRINIAERFFSKEEYGFLLSVSDEQKRTDDFFRIWTLKESYTKLLGEGIYRPFDSFSFDISKEGRIILSQGKEAAGEEPAGKYSFFTFSENGFRYSVAEENSHDMGKSCYLYKLSDDELAPADITM